MSIRSRIEKIVKIKHKIENKKLETGILYLQEPIFINQKISYERLG